MATLLQNRSIPLFTAVVTTTLATAAQAHTGQVTVEGLPSGFLYPIARWDYLVAKVAIALRRAFLGTPAIWILPVVFPLVMAFGGMLGVMGVPLSNFASPWFAVPSLLAGIACAVLAIISHDYRPALVKGLAFVTALVAMISVLEDHAFMTLPVSIYIGLFLGATAAFVLAAAVARIMIEKLPTVIARIAARILSSWTAAIALMLLAFQVQKLMSGV